jgi:hypothetical protein
MKLKLDEQGHVVVSNGFPVYVHDDGKEVEFDAPRAVATIKRISDERDAARTEAEAFAKLKGHSADELLAAVKTVKALDEKKLVEAGKVDEVVAERMKAATEAWLGKETEFKTQLEAEQRKVHSLVVSRRFADSKVLKEKAAPSVTPRVAEALFGQRFKVEGDRPVPLDETGKPIYSKSRPGEIADFDEGLEAMIASHPDAKDLLKAAVGSGPAAAGGNGRTAGAKLVTRAELAAMPPAAQAKHFAEGGNVTD